MPTIERSLVIDAPTARVYDAFVDFTRWLEWNPHFREVRPLTDGPLEKGLKVRLALKLSPLASVWEVTEVSPGRSFAWTSSSFPAHRITFDHIAEAADAGTRATYRINVEGPLSFLAGAAASFYGRNLNHSLAALKRMIEGETPSPPAPQQPAAQEREPEAVPEPEPAAEAQPETEAEPKNE